MASRMIHLAITTALLKTVPVKDGNRLKFGAVLPDADNRPMVPDNSHFRENICGGTKRTYHLTKYRNWFKEKLESDELYLGYYLHLIQDIVYRRFVYEDYHWDSAPPGNVERLHRDYAYLNPYIIEKHHLSGELSLPQNFQEEDLQKMFRFDAPGLLRDMKSDFFPCERGGFFFFTPGMADEYIEKAAEVCACELEAIRNHSPLLDEIGYAWEVKRKTSSAISTKK